MSPTAAATPSVTPPLAVRLNYHLHMALPDRWRGPLRRLATRGAEAVPGGLAVAARERLDRALRAGDRPRALASVAGALARRPVPAGVDDFSPPGQPDLRFVADGSRELRELYWLGAGRDLWYSEEIRTWQALCRASTSVLEIGANVGIFTVAGGLVCPGRYTAVEPHPGSAAVLRANVALNDLGARVDVVEAAAVRAGAPARLELVMPATDDPTPTGAQLRTVPDAMRLPVGGATVVVDTVPVTDLVEGVDLLKIDVEGLEAELVRALAPHLVDHGPPIVLEVLPHADELRGVLAELAPRAGYRGWAMTRAGVVPVAVEQLGPATLADLSTWDLLLARDLPAGLTLVG